MKYDVHFFNPMNSAGIHYAVEADSLEHAASISPYQLSASSQWLPEQFTVFSVEKSIYEES
jgi:hypothetical protein